MELSRVQGVDFVGQRFEGLGVGALRLYGREGFASPEPRGSGKLAFRL